MQHLSQDYFLRLRFHHHNLIALPWKEKAALIPTYEGQLVPLANHIIQLRRRPEFEGVNQLADLLLQPMRSHKRRRKTTYQADVQEQQEEEVAILY